MACSLGAIFSALMGVGGVFGDVPDEEIVRYVRAAVRDLFPAG
jgi:hypothetical protein